MGEGEGPLEGRGTRRRPEGRVAGGLATTVGRTTSLAVVGLLATLVEPAVGVMAAVGLLATLGL